MSTQLVAKSSERVSLVQKFAHRFSIDPGQLLPILKATAFQVKGGEVSNEQMAALLVVADQALVPEHIGQGLNARTLLMQIGGEAMAQ